MKSEQDWYEWMIENFPLSDRQLEYAKRGELHDRLHKLDNLITGYESLSNIGINAAMIKVMRMQRQAIYRFLRVYDSLGNCKQCSSDIKFPQHDNFYLNFIKALRDCGLYLKAADFANFTLMKNTNE